MFDFNFLKSKYAYLFSELNKPFWSGPALYLMVTEDGEYFWEEINA